MAIERLGRYRLLRLLATGGMGEVFLGEQEGPKEFRKKVVVKRLLRHLANDLSFVDMFVNEARLAALIVHPNVVHIVELGEADGAYFIVMEYVRGKSLRQMLRATRAAGVPIPTGVAVHIVIEVLRGLSAAHTLADEAGAPRGIVHRDVSAENVLVAYEGAVKIADFGVAKAMSLSTVKGTVLRGKYGYMAPEQYTRGTIDARTDLFACGVLLYELLAGERPFTGEHEVGVMHATLQSEPPRLTDCPARLEAAVLRALAKDPNERFQTTAAMAEELEACVAMHDWDATSTAVRQHMRALFATDIDTVELEGTELPEGTPALTDEASSVQAAEPSARSVALTVSEVPRKRDRKPLLAAVGAIAGIAVIGGIALSMRRSPNVDANAQPSASAESSAASSSIAASPPSAPIEPPASPSAPEPTAADNAPAPDLPRGAKPRSGAVAKPVAKSGTGTLALRVRPWAEVFVDGKRMGVSPLAPMELPVGRHSVLLRNKDLGKERTLPANVTRGETTTLKADLFE